MIRRLVAEKSLSHCTEVAGTLRKPRANTSVVGYTDALSCSQSQPNCCQQAQTGTYESTNQQLQEIHHHRPFSQWGTNRFTILSENTVILFIC